jgi:hypothetical protein
MGSEIPPILASLSCSGFDVSKFDETNGRIVGLHDVSKASDLIIIAGDIGWNRIAADEIWHLCRNKIIISLVENLRILDLRDIYPLSKICRCRASINADVERSLLVLAFDRSFSEIDLAFVKDVLGVLGEILCVKEKMLEGLSLQMDASIAVIREVTYALRESAGSNRLIYDCVLDWLLYGIGDAGIKGSALDEIVPKGKEFDPETISEIHRAVKKALESCGIKVEKPMG